MANRLNVQNIYASDSDTTAAVQVSGANITLNGTANDLGTVTAGTIGGGVAMASSGLTVRNIEQVALTSDQSLGNNGTLTTFFSPTYTPKFSGSKVMGCLNGVLYLSYLGVQDGRKVFVMSFSGSDITNIDYGANQQIGGYDHGGSGGVITTNFTTMGPLLTTSGTSTITCDCKLQNATTSTASSWIVFGNNTLTETFFTWIEFK